MPSKFGQINNMEFSFLFAEMTLQWICSLLFLYPLPFSMPYAMPRHTMLRDTSFADVKCKMKYRRPTKNIENKSASSTNRIRGILEMEPTIIRGNTYSGKRQGISARWILYWRWQLTEMRYTHFTIQKKKMIRIAREKKTSFNIRITELPQ